VGNGGGGKKSGEMERERKGVAPRVKTFDFSVEGGVRAGKGGQGSLGDFRF